MLDANTTFKINGEQWTFRTTPLRLRVKGIGETGSTIDLRRRVVLVSTDGGPEIAAERSARAVALIARETAAKSRRKPATPRRRTLPPYRWRVVPGRLFTRDDNGPWVERAYAVDHDARVTTIAGVLRPHERAMAAELAMRCLGGCRVAAVPAAWRRACTAEVLPEFVTIGGRRYEVVTVPRLVGRGEHDGRLIGTRVDHDARRVLINGSLCPHFRRVALTVAVRRYAGTSA